MSDTEINITEKALDDIFGRLRDRSSFHVDQGDWVNISPVMRLRLGGATGHLENGSVKIIDPLIGGPRGQIKELDLKWDRLDIDVGLDIPEICGGGYCVIPDLSGGCAVRAPRKCIFGGNPDIWGTIPLGGLRHEISTAFNTEVRRVPNKWEVHLKSAQPLDFDFLDISDMAGDLMELIIDALIDKLLKPLPRWARDLVRAIFGDIVKLIKQLLDFADDLLEWVSEKIGISLGLINLGFSLVLAELFKPDPILELDDPYEILPEAQGLPAVRAGITDVVFEFSTNPNLLVASIKLEEA